jgi:hypothetical protein
LVVHAKGGRVAALLSFPRALVREGCQRPLFSARPLRLSHKSRRPIAPNVLVAGNGSADGGTPYPVLLWLISAEPRAYCS